jgi:hypothetical protein
MLIVVLAVLLVGVICVALTIGAGEVGDNQTPTEQTPSESTDPTYTYPDSLILTTAPAQQEMTVMVDKLTFEGAFDPSQTLLINGLKIIPGEDGSFSHTEFLKLGSNEITYALSEPLRAIVEELKDALEQTPAELCGDITETGICLTGGSAQLYGLDKFISEQTGVPCYVAEDPASCVAIGAGRVLEDLKTYRNVLYDYRRGDYYEA